MKSSIHKTVEKATDLTCPFFAKKYCNSDKCMAWVWTKWDKKIRTEALKSDYDNLIRPTDVPYFTPTHGICALIHKGEKQNV